MQSTSESSNSTVDAIKDALRYLGDASYAVLPEDVAHRLADLKKNLVGGLRCALDKELEWIDARVAGGDRLRQEWRERRAQNKADERTAGEGI
ncbi:MAG TPA: hypothetical protein VM095_04840 [Pyrinomonadaceae bacterium]|nr:hypothetical protein [Pyrinomonadaceae bacterium]